MSKVHPMSHPMNMSTTGQGTDAVMRDQGGHYRAHAPPDLSHKQATPPPNTPPIYPMDSHSAMKYNYGQWNKIISANIVRYKNVTCMYKLLFWHFQILYLTTIYQCITGTMHYPWQHVSNFVKPNTIFYIFTA